MMCSISNAMEVDLYCSEVAHRVTPAMEQVSVIPLRINNATVDPALVSDERVLSNLLQLEMSYLPSPSYFDCVQNDIEPWMRDAVASWMLEVGLHPLQYGILFVYVV